MAIALWMEFTPEPTVELLVLTDDVAAGTPLEPEHVRTTRVQDTGIATVEPEGVAATDLKAGDPLIASVVTQVAIPSGWVVIEAPVPVHAPPGAAATAVVVSSLEAPVTFQAMVTTGAGEDTFGPGTGTIAIPAEWVAVAAAAAARGELVIGVGGPSR